MKKIKKVMLIIFLKLFLLILWIKQARYLYTKIIIIITINNNTISNSNDLLSI